MCNGVGLSSPTTIGYNRLLLLMPDSKMFVVWIQWNSLNFYYLTPMRFFEMLSFESNEIL